MNENKDKRIQNSSMQIVLYYSSILVGNKGNKKNIITFLRLFCSVKIQTSEGRFVQIHFDTLFWFDILELLNLFSQSRNNGCTALT